MEATISFPGGVVVRATIGTHSVDTDQPLPVGTDAAMSPFDLFFASIGTCMGFYALRFCQERGIATEGLALKVDAQRDADGKRVVVIRADLQLPPEFPEKYRDAIRRAVDHCAVKRVLMDPPEFELKIA